ncbi:MAG TPA: monovalent cation/H(+) antiporter subunit G [Stellaceae bacterium]|nr:monovalent cation/H(+) antiporter subunit G [Stellaceae bacterium]
MTGVAGIAVSVLLGLAVLSAWLACFALLRFRAALDRLHCSAFVNAAGGGFVAAAVLVQDRATDRSLKVLAILAILVLGSAALSHAVGRAILLRDGTGSS